MPGEGEGEGGRVPQAGVRGPELRPRPALRAAGLHAGGGPEALWEHGPRPREVGAGGEHHERRDLGSGGRGWPWCRPVEMGWRARARGRALAGRGEGMGGQGSDPGKSPET